MKFALSNSPNRMNLDIHLLASCQAPPAYAHPTDSGIDLSANEEVLIPAGEWRTVGTGIAITLPPLTEAQIRPRSGLAANYGVTVLNSPGTIDEGYQGEVKVILINHSLKAFLVRRGMRIAQMVIAPVLRPTLASATPNPVESARGENGFGSTGI